MMKSGIDEILASMTADAWVALVIGITTLIVAIIAIILSVRANGRAARQQRVEYAISFMGPNYDGITAVFFPFPISKDDFGRVIMFVNDSEKPGVIRFESDLPRGERAGRKSPPITPS